ncbi:TPA: hypothetical protein ACH3X3_007896 [Trebouxia sp. C0006]
MEWGTECKFLVLLQLQHAKVIIRMWLVGRREAETCSVSWSKGVRVMAERAGFGENIPFKIAIEALLKEAWTKGDQKEATARATEASGNDLQGASRTARTQSKKRQQGKKQQSKQS